MICSREKWLDTKNISKVFFLLYMVYSNVMSYSLFFVRGLSSILLIGAIIMEIFYDGFTIKIEKSFVALLLFSVYVMVSGIIVARNYDRVLNSAIPFIEYLMVFYLVICYIRFDRKPDFPMAVFIVQALIAVMIMIYKGTGIQRVSISEDVNVNTLGVMFAFAIGFILYMLISRENKPIKLYISIAAITVLILGIIMTVSKKAVISGVVLISLWMIFCYRFTFAKMNKFLRLLVFAGMIAISIFIYRWYASNYSFRLELLKNRMNQLYTGESDQMRLQLIKEGFSLFLSHPFLGVGFNNFRFYTSYNTYTHCFYSELFACTGIIGVLIFGYAMFRPWVIVGRNSRFFKMRDTVDNIQTIYILVIFAILLALSFGQIIFYTPNLMFVLSIITGYAVNIVSDE